MHRASTAPPVVFNRLRAVLLHVPFYATDSLARLASDTGISSVSIFRYAKQQANPSPPIASVIARAISERAGRQVRPREIFSKNGSYQTPSACELMGCTGCFPPEAWNESTDMLRPKWRHQKPGEWSKTKPGEWSRREADPTSPGQII